ncbi:hypothetical protein U2F26_32540 [Micromonospora sp. 4G57]|uniref:Sigma-70 family RNA polymerase sigma factor n=1 Tax=Micromonospora sicca TaxID=2202420 RepID=A0ABU5JN56_9ACTN|nr:MULTISPECIES: hypothetical protein [unclassified Micromonospora]MDZ5447382.1 hypothetical protein [Micromonospora sp. 4G57]MDZ5494053.1 hypothetical protein [Micromonospora sp. 4G53]
MTAWEELRRDGVFGTEATVELYRCVRAVARAGNFPPPDGHPAWNLDAVAETAHDIFADARGPQRLVELAVKAHDDASLRRLLEQVVRNFLRDKGRATAKGRLIRRLREVLTDDPRFAVVPSGRPGAGRNIELADGTTPGVWNGRSSDLVSAAYKVTDVSIVRWRTDARRESPVADAISLAAVCEAVLRAAGASLSIGEVADAVAARFAVGPAPVVTPVDDVDPWLPGVNAVDQAQVEAEVLAGAGRLLAQLTPRERLVLAYLDQPVRRIADHTGLGKSVTAQIAARVREIVSQVLGGEEHREDMLSVARAMATPRTVND